jgi:hypothetical protein
VINFNWKTIPFSDLNVFSLSPKFVWQTFYQAFLSLISLQP